MSQKGTAPTDHNTSTQYFHKYYWCINTRGTLYVLPIPSGRHHGSLFETTIRLGRLSSVNWSSVKRVKNKKVDAIILGVVEEAKEKDDEEDEGEQGGLEDSFVVVANNPLFYMLDETNFWCFEDHPDGRSWAKSEVVTAAYQRTDDLGTNPWRGSKGKWLRDIFKGTELSVTDPRTPHAVFAAPPNDQELQDKIVENRERDALFDDADENESMQGAYFFPLFSLDV